MAHIFNYLDSEPNLELSDDNMIDDSILGNLSDINFNNIDDIQKGGNFGNLTTDIIYEDDDIDVDDYTSNDVTSETDNNKQKDSNIDDEIQKSDESDQSDNDDDDFNLDDIDDDENDDENR